MAENYDYLFKICIFAGKNVGKKTLAKRFPNFEDYLMGEVSGVNFLLKTIEIYNKIVKLQYWLLATSIEGFKSPLWEQYLKGAIGVIIMYDITNRKSLNNLSEWH